MKRIEELIDENNGMAEETQILTEQVYGLQGVNANQEELIHQLQIQLRQISHLNSSSRASGGLMGVDRSCCGSV